MTGAASGNGAHRASAGARDRMTRPRSLAATVPPRARRL